MTTTMIGRERRDRNHRDYSPKSDGRSGLPPSRHLWIGNLSHHIDESELLEQCLRFGEVESVAFLPGRSYAFVNYSREDDAILAMRALQGFVLAGLPLRIEFAKAERSLPPPHDDYQQQKDGRHSVEHSTPFQRDSTPRLTTPEKPRTEKPKMGDKNAEPSEVLWIGFPLSLNVDEILLRRSFSPFGEIEKITSFPGRSYAFVKFRTILAACRAKEALQGKLFNNPRVSISFAKNDMNTHDQERSSITSPFSPHFKPNSHLGKFDNSFVEPYRGSPRFNPDLEFGNPSFLGFGRNAPQWTGPNGNFEPMNFQGPRTNKRGFSQDLYERENSPPRHDFPWRAPFNEDPPDMQESFFFNEAKKLKRGPSPQYNKELIEYPFRHEHGFSKALPPTLPEHGNFGPGPFRPMNEERNDTRNGPHSRLESGPGPGQGPGPLPMNSPHPLEERNNIHYGPHNRLEAGPGLGRGPGPGPLPMNPIKWNLSSPESRKPPLKEEWKWEGTIAKGGTPVCRARCFPVGKPLDVILPGYLNCTARTGLEMLAKHFYQAANSWVVFFVPESDSDIALYNDFMNYLLEKQRAAVAKLGEKMTLFLVPPSDFSEKVLKVPGKLSISGVILQFQENLNSDLALDPTFPEPVPAEVRVSSWAPSQSYTPLPPENFPRIESDRYYQHQHRDPQFPSNLSDHQIQNSTADSIKPPQVVVPATVPPPLISESVSDAPSDSRYYRDTQSNWSQNSSANSVKPPQVVAPEPLTNILSLLLPQQNPGNGPVPKEEANPHARLQATLQLAASLLHQIQQQSKATEQR